MFKHSLLVLGLLGALSLPARAVDLSAHGLGVGVVGQIASSNEALLSVRAPLAPRLLAGVLVGFSAVPGVSFKPGLRFDWVLVPEAHMNVSVGGAIAVELRSVGGLSGVPYRLGPSIELFTSDWPNLGFLIDFGLAGYLAAGENAYQPAIATSLSPYGAGGIHYYF